MARLSEETITKIFDLQRQFLDRINEATATEFILFEQHGETEETMSELNELQNIRERADLYYSRFHIILRRIYESQPVASNANLELLAQTIEEAEAVSEATFASIQEIKRNWNLS
jgi:hypothetical protein